MSTRQESSNRTAPAAATTQPDIDKLAEIQREKSAELSRLIDQISEAITKSKAVAAIAPTDRRERSNGQLETNVEIDERRLAARRLANGDVAYAIPGDAIRTAGGILGTPDAFVERGLRTRSPYIEVTGASDRQIAAAMAHAVRRWKGDDVVIHAEGKNEKKVIFHAVRAGLNIVNKDERVQAIVAEERARLDRPHRAQGGSREQAPIIERVGRSR